MKRNRTGRFLIAAGVLFLAAAVGLAGYNLWDSHRAGQSADQAAAALMEAISNAPASPAQDGEDPVVVVLEEGYIGLLEIPDLGLSLPVQADWDYDKLRFSPCRFSGTCRGNDLVICGHNYTSHFGPLLGIDIGADVYLTTADGRAHHYIVANREVLEPTAVEDMVDREDGDWDLTLFTCTLGGQTRCTVRCVRASDDVSY